MPWCSTNGSALQALSTRADTAEAVEALAGHPDFTLANPNRLRSLVGAFAVNQRAFHDASGRGYRFLADMILAADKLNPQTAAKLVPPLGRWRRFGANRAGADAGRARADRRRPGPQQGRVRAGVEEPGLNGTFVEAFSRRSMGGFDRDLVGGLVERRGDRSRRCPSAGTRASKRRVSTGCRRGDMAAS